MSIVRCRIPLTGTTRQIRGSSVASAIFTTVTYLKFYPASRYELSKERSRRIFSVAIDSADGTLLVKAADWPNTFLSPFTLGESNWPDRFVVSKLYWSNDRSVAVFSSQEKGESVPTYSAAYDFNDHRGLDREASKESKDSFSKKNGNPFVGTGWA